MAAKTPIPTEATAQGSAPLGDTDAKIKAATDAATKSIADAVEKTIEAAINPEAAIPPPSPTMPVGDADSKEAAAAMAGIDPDQVLAFANYPDYLSIVTIAGQSIKVAK